MIDDDEDGDNIRTVSSTDDGDITEDEMIMSSLNSADDMFVEFNPLF